jgi:hypothetical protein
MRRSVLLITTMMLISLACQQVEQDSGIPLLEITENSRFFQDDSGNPFFWLGDTGWLLFTRLTREEAQSYLEDRAAKGFNVIQVMVLHTLDAVNVYGDSALVERNVADPLVTEGNLFSDPLQYDYWDHVDYVLDLAAEKGLYMGLVCVWGDNVRSGGVSREEARTYAAWLADRYGGRDNVIWINGGDTPGNDSTATWNIIGNTLWEHDPDHLITFHPRGRLQSSMWFHEEPWLSFNMFQSGHRRYDQDDTELNYGEDNWRYARDDYSRTPVKPTLDGEPSYEGIPQGLHDPSEPYWTANDVRRYAYWSVFAGCAGFTYGHNAIMQFHKPGNPDPDYGVNVYWYDALQAPGGGQMQHLKKLMLSRPYFDRVPDTTLVGSTQGARYDYQAATRGKDYAFIYTWNGREIEVNMGRIEGNSIRASWFDPRTSEFREIGDFENSGQRVFDPPGSVEDGNDWVLVLDALNV